jgi:DNA invertase Pin-like site-specific DNA recombinase
MASGRFIAYYRVSTQQQGRSGLGLEAQRQAVAIYLNGGSCQLVAEFTEVESGKGSNALHRRPQLRAALDACKKHKATLLIAKLDRLARNVHFITGLIESGTDFVAADMPNANKVMLQMHAVMSEWERDQISARTRAALVQAKARGVVLGAAGARNLEAHRATRIRDAQAFVDRLRGVFEGFGLRGLSQRQMVTELNALGIKTPRGACWRLKQVQRAMGRLRQAAQPRLSKEMENERKARIQS